jgi:hypothetical protein
MLVKAMDKTKERVPLLDRIGRLESLVDPLIAVGDAISEVRLLGSIQIILIAHIQLQGPPSRQNCSRLCKENSRG